LVGKVEEKGLLGIIDAVLFNDMTCHSGEDVGAVVPTLINIFGTLWSTVLILVIPQSTVFSSSMMMKMSEAGLAQM